MRTAGQVVGQKGKSMVNQLEESRPIGLYSYGFQYPVLCPKDYHTYELMIQ